MPIDSQREALLRHQRVLAASGSVQGASRDIMRRASGQGWLLMATPYVIDEVSCNLSLLSPQAAVDWKHLQSQLAIMPDVLTLNKPVVFEPTKDRPILFSALAWADVLLTLDRADFGSLMDSSFYGLPILTPGSFLERERAAGRL